MSNIYFYKGADNVMETPDKYDVPPIERIQKSFEKVLDGKNLSFLLGSGCSSFYVNDDEIGISTMKPLARKFYNEIMSEKNKEALNKQLLISA